MPVTLVVLLAAVVAAVGVWALSRRPARPIRSTRRPRSGGWSGWLGAPSPASARPPGRSTAGVVGGLMLRRRPGDRLRRPRSSSGSCSTWSTATAGWPAGTGRSPSGAAEQRHDVVDRRCSTGSPTSVAPPYLVVLVVAVAVCRLRRHRNANVRAVPRSSSSSASCCINNGAQVDRRPRTSRRPAPRRDVRLVVPVRALGGGGRGVVRRRPRRRPPLVAARPGRRPPRSPR